MLKHHKQLKKLYDKVPKKQDEYCFIDTFASTPALDEFNKEFLKVLDKSDIHISTKLCTCQEL